MKPGSTITLPKLKNSQNSEKTKIHPPPKKVKTNLSAGKGMATVFWDSYKFILIDYLEQGKPINGQLLAIIERQSPHFSGGSGSA